MSDELSTFSDPLALGFSGFPTDRDDARAKWADAFEAMLDHIVPAATLQPTYAAVARTAFFDTLELANGISAKNAATDLADAWSAAILTFAPGASLPAFGSWTPGVVALQHAALETALKALFATPGFVAAQQLAAVAAALHLATVTLTAVTTNGVALAYT